jgi:carboxylesterase
VQPGPQPGAHGDASPFDFVGDEGSAGVLLIHGFTGTPYEMRYLGERLTERGLTAVGPTLPGHGTSIDDLDATRWQDWVAAVDDAFTALRARCREVAVVGQSLGGLLALDLASRRSAEMLAVGTLAAPLWLGGLATAVIRAAAPGRPLARVGLSRLPKLGGSDVRSRDAKRANPSYRAIPLRALRELAAFMRVVDGELAAVCAPTLIVHAADDHTAPVACAARIRNAIGAPVVRSRILTESFHLIAIDVERDVVAAEVAAFIAAQRRQPRCST